MRPRAGPLGSAVFHPPPVVLASFILRLARSSLCLASALWLCGCTQRLYEGAPRAPERVAVIHVGSVIVRGIDGKPRRGGAFDAAHFEVAPGTHRLTVVFELPARSVGLRSLPAQQGIGSCELVIAAHAGRQYYLGARALGDSLSPRWNGRWEAWVRDPATEAEDDIIARCSAPAESDAAAPSAAAPPPSPPAAGAAPIGAPPAAAPASPSPTPAAATLESIRLGTWNLRGLGRGADRDYTRIAQVIEQHFDVIALTEIAATPDGPVGYERLLAALGPPWLGMVSAPPRPDARGEHYAVLYRRAAVRACAGWNALRDAVPAAGSARFVRPPVFTCLEAGDPARPGFDFLLAVYRAPTGDGDATITALEVAQLESVFDAMRAARAGEADVLIAGDFHLEAVELADTLRAEPHASPDGSRLNLLGEPAATRTDHVLVLDDGATIERVGDIEVLDVRGIADSARAFYRTVSDHLPVAVRLLVVGPDDD